MGQFSREKVGQLSNEIDIAPDNAILILDGVFLLRPDLNRFWDIRIYVDIDAEQSVERGVEHDLTLDDVEVQAARRELRIRVFRERYVPAEELYLRDVAPTALADIVVDNRDLAAPQRFMRRRSP